MGSTVLLTIVIVILAIAAPAAAFFIHAKMNRQLMLAQLALREEQGRSKMLESRLADREINEEMMRQTAHAQFESLASRIIERETKHFQESSEKGLERLLLPLRERLKDFEKKVDDSYQAEGKERVVLKAEVARLITLNERMAIETNHLTSALKGDSKVQGDWGEMILETILESSGLREGIEYSAQQSLTNYEGERFRPDVIINLPDNKQIIVDSKVSLSAYEQHVRACSLQGNEAERERYLKAHIESISRHVDDLAQKHYPKLKGLNTPEFVFLFTPIEPAYVLAMRTDPDLITRAWKKGVAIVTASTLFTSLKTVGSIWRLEHQKSNAQEIADEAAKLYDKFVGFHEDFEKIGRLFETGLKQYEDARRKLRDGPGNVFRKIELLRELGAAPSKRLKPELLE